MPALQLVRGKDGHLRINDGVTRATRAAKFRPGTMVPAEVIPNLPRLGGDFFVQTSAAGLIEDAEVKRPGVQVDAAVKLVGLVVKSHRGLLGLGGV